MQTFKTAKKDPGVIAAHVFGLIKAELELVEIEFGRNVDSNIQVVGYLSDYLRKSGGKRIRPALLLLSNRAAGGNSKASNVIGLATVMEMLHTATLVHDDIIDNADTRRNMPSVNARFGNQASVLMGDWLYMSAFEISLGERNLRILDILTSLTRRMTEGELIQLTAIGRTDLDEDTYFDILRRKTAYLFSACCEIGALLAGAEENEIEAFRNYGLDLGIAFQLADDYLDFTSRKDVLGKASGADLLEGKLTLPLITLVSRNPEALSVIERIMIDGEYKDGNRETLNRMLSETGILEETRKRAYEFAESAKKNLAILEETEYRVALEDIPTFMIDRKK
ncbi:MAG: polyprenyl synthetase family protein [Pyrinomonadaceae bacterium]